MTTTLFQRQLLNRRKLKKNAFTLIELMVVVAIVGVLSAVGLPELTKAQNRAKDATAQATVTNAAKECALALIADDAALYSAEDFEVGDGIVQGDCQAGTELTATSPTGATIDDARGY